MVFSKQKFLLGKLIMALALPLLCFSHSLPSFIAYSQVELLDESSSIAPQTDTVTSYYDALLKIPLILSQTAIVGVAFSHMFLRRIIRKRTRLGHGQDSSNAEINGANIYLRPIKRFSTVILSCGIAILVSATSLLLLQAISLSSALGMDTTTTLNILSSTPVGPVWNIRVITSLIIIVTSILYYIFEKKYIMKKQQTKDDSNSVTHSPPQNNTGKKSSILFPTILLYFMMLAGAVSILSNSIVSHNTALSFFPSLAISMDWLHFMAVSLWLGGLFYISSILLMTIRLSISKNSNIDGRVNKSFNDNIAHNTSYFLALLLPCFSLVATMSLGIIGITGLYMAWIHLHTVEAIFASSYGNILVIKLGLALPMVVLGGYYQLKLHGSLMEIASLNKGGQERHGEKANAYGIKSTSNHENTFPSQYDPSRKFDKTIKMESLIGIGVLSAASFLTITSPPSISFQDSLSTENSLGVKGQQQDYIPSFDSFTILAIILGAAVLLGSITYFKKSRQQVRNTLAYFESLNE
ncbi:MAG: copper resistance D family protein [Nitrososphaeraceae archaeon]